MNTQLSRSDKYSLDQFTNKYSITKTLRFELKPIGKTLANIESKGLIQQDEQRAEDYCQVKELIDDYHQHFIELALSNASVDGNILREFETLYRKEKKDENDRKRLFKIQSEFRKEIAKCFSNRAEYINLFNKELIRMDLPKFIETAGYQDKETKKALVSKFRNFTTYFRGFHENRKNLYVADKQSTAVVYRIFHDNLPKFLDNRKIFQHIRRHYSDILPKTVEEELSSFLQGKSIDSIFELEFFQQTFTQNGIDRYNTILGGKSLADGKKVPGINEYINLHRQKNGLSRSQVPNLKQLYKQILSDRISASWLPEAFTTSNEVLDAIRQFYSKELMSWTNNESAPRNVFYDLAELIGSLSKGEFRLDKIFVYNLSTLSNDLFGDWSLINNALAWHKEKEIKSAKPKKRSTNKPSNEAFSISQIEAALNEFKSVKDDLAPMSLTPICDYFVHFGKREYGKSNEALNHIQRIEKHYKEVEPILNAKYVHDKELIQNNSHVEKLKSFLDSILDLLHFVKLLHPKEAEDKDEGFYSSYEPLYDQLNLITPIYNKVRNFVTQKPYSVEKIRLNFENKGDLLGGWVDSCTESDNGTQFGGYLFRKRNGIGEFDYFLGISKDSKLFRVSHKLQVASDDSSEYERLEYYQVKPRTIYGASYKGNYKKDKETLRNAILEYASENCEPLVSSGVRNYLEKDQSTPKRCLEFLEQQHNKDFMGLLSDEKFCEINLKIIHNLQDALKELSRIPNVSEYSRKNYKLFTEVMDDIDNLSKGKFFSYFPVSTREIEEAASRTNRPLFLFKISNKDLSFADSFAHGKRKSRGKDNLHTLYFKQLLGGQQRTFDIGSGEVFYRKETRDLSKSTITHSKGKPIRNKNPLNPKVESLFDYDIIKNRRFTRPQFHFHLSIGINYESPEEDRSLNTHVLNYVRSNPNINIIGIDRGERNLLYLTLIDQRGTIKEQFSLNEIVNSYKTPDSREIEVRTDYQEKLKQRESSRAEKRKSWGEIENIKELKEGYLSQVIHKIATLMVEHNAIVVMEDLNLGFKNSRKKVERQVYQKFEKMLIDKLNFLVFKDKPQDEVGGLRRGLQLTSKFTSFKDLKFQSGFIFYVPPSYTSAIDPTTGFVNLLWPKQGPIDQFREFFRCFESIKFNSLQNYFEFEFDYSQFPLKIKFSKGARTNWTACTTNVERYKWDRKRNDTRKFHVTDGLKDLFDKFGIEYSSGRSLKDDILRIEDKSFYLSLTELLKVTLSLRHTFRLDENKTVDCIISPVMNSSGTFFNSLEADSTLPTDADANGAYHIALKGLFLLQERINRQSLEAVSTNENTSQIKLTISNEEWLRFAQDTASERLCLSSNRGVLVSDNRSGRPDGELHSDIIS